MSATLSRRKFIGASLLAGGGLLFDISVPLRASAQGSEASVLTAFVRILPDNSVVIGGKNAEIGQGAKTSLPMLIAEELDVDWASVTVEQTHADQSLFGSQSAGGSRTTGREWLPMRQAGAAARAMLVAAAAQHWGVPADRLETASGTVRDPQSGRSIAYGELAEAAASIEPPALDDLKLKSPDQYTIIGQPVVGVDTPAIVAGKPLFGIDVDLPGMLHAVLETCPALGGRYVAANLDEVRALPGVDHVLLVEGDGAAESLLDGVAILGKSWWSVNEARKKLSVEWDDSAQRGFSTEAYREQAASLLAQAPTQQVRLDGDPEAALAGAATLVEAQYDYPTLAHGTLEPQNCTALFEEGKIEIWAPTQNPENGRALVAEALGIAPENIRINLTRIGGGFGRRLMNDYMVQAAAIARQVPGIPVKLLYQRQDEFRRDFFRPGGWHKFRAGLDADGKLVALTDQYVTYGSGGEAARAGELAPTLLPAGLLDHLAYGQSLIESNLPGGWLRAPRSNAFGFVTQGFLDEVAEAAGKDLPTLMLELLAEDRSLHMGTRSPPFVTSRAHGVIRKVLEMGNWSGRGSREDGQGRGFAFYFSHAGYFAEIVDVAVEGTTPTVEKVWVAGDVGSQIVNPLNALHQVQGSVIEGLGQALVGQEVTQVNGAVEQSNFDRHPFMRIHQVPEVLVEFVTTDNPPTGLGEPALPPVIPALVNALYDATGTRVRSLPVRL